MTRRWLAATACALLLAGLVTVTTSPASAVQSGLLEANLTVASGGTYDPTRMTMLGIFVAADFPSLDRADVVDEEDNVLVTLHPSSPAVDPEVFYMQANFTVDISTMHHYRLIAYDKLDNLVTTSNVQSYGPIPGPESLTAKATLDTSHGYVHLIDLTWALPTLPESISQDATPALFSFTLRNEHGRKVGYGCTRADQPVYTLTLGEPLTDDWGFVQGSLLRPGQYTVRARSLPTYGLGCSPEVPLGAPTSTSVTVPPEPADLTIAKPRVNIHRGEVVALHGHLRAKYSDLRTPETKVRIYSRATRSDDWRHVETVMTGRHGRYDFAVTVHGQHMIVRAESALTTSLKAAADAARLTTT